MSKPKYVLLSEEINRLKEHLTDLCRQLKMICPHKDVVMDSFQEDDWAFPGVYTTSYKCKCCGMYGQCSEPNKSEAKKSKEFIELETAYRKNNVQRCKKSV